MDLALTLEMNERNSEILINVLKKTDGDLNDQIFVNQAVLIERIQSKVYQGARDGLFDSLT